MPRTREICNSDNIIDSRDVIARITKLEGELEDTFNAESRIECEECGGAGTVEHAIDGTVEDGAIAADCDGCSGDGTVWTGDTFEEWLTNEAENGGNSEAQELIALRAFAEEGESVSDWSHGEAFIRDDYFEYYARDLHEDINGRDSGRGWPFDYIDWDAAADALKQDYTPVDFDGVTYWARS